MGAIEVWRGACNAWECDEMGHMNVRFYVSRALDGLAGLSLELGLPDPYQPSVSSMLAPREHHVRFLKEARAGAALHLEAQLVEIGAEELTVVQVLRHTSTGEPCAAMTSRCAHTTLDGRIFPWSEHTHAAAQALKGEAPDFAAARSIGPEMNLAQASLANADKLGMIVTGRGVIGRRDCDAFGRMRSDAVMGRLSDGAAHLFGPGAQALAQETGKRLGGALLETRIRHLKVPRLGARYVMRSGLSRVEPKLSYRVDWMLDPESGEALTVARGVATSLDLEARKSFERSPSQMKLFEGQLVKGLEI